MSHFVLIPVLPPPRSDQRPLMTVNHVFDSAVDAPSEPPSAAARASISVGPEGDGAATPTVTPALGLASVSFSSQTSSRGVRSHPSLDSEAMVDAALSNMIHDVEALPSSLPPLPDLAASAMQHAHAHTHVHSHSHSHAAAAAHAALNIFDVL
jgi:hypothetical protein